MKREVEGATYPAHIQAAVDRVIAAATDHDFIYAVPNHPSVKAILELPLNDQVDVITALIMSLTFKHDGAFWDVKLKTTEGYYLRPVLSVLLRRELPFNSEILTIIIKLIALYQGAYIYQYVPLQAILRAVSRYVHRHGLPAELQKGLEKLKAEFEKGHYVPNLGARPIYEPNTTEKACLKSISAILQSQQPESNPEPERMNLSEPWAAAMWRDLDALPPDHRQSWHALLQQVQNHSGSKPTKKWLAKTSTLVSEIGRDRFQSLLARWLTAATQFRSDLPLPERVEIGDLSFTPSNPNLLLSETSQTTLKGLAWAASLCGGEDICTALGDLGESCWKKIPGHGPRSKLVGNAVFWSLSAIGTDVAVTQLTRINSRLKHASARKLGDGAMNRVAATTGQTREDLEEISVPTFGLSEAGMTAQTVSGFTMTLAITDSFEAELRFNDTAGKARKSVPAEIKVHHGVELLATQKNLKRLQSILPGQKARVEGIFRNPERSWSFTDWRSRYLEHPVMSRLARRLIWRFTPVGGVISCMPMEGKFLTAEEQVVSVAAAQTRVQLWHPCTDTAEDVQGWRRFLEKHQITQPFKQAHREVYLLTDAERNTATYSNRFAAHIIRQHQFNALCAARGWQYKLQGSWDGGSPIPTLDIAALGLKVEFWVEAIGVGENLATASSGVALNLSTDQVRFYRRQPFERLPLDQIHPQAFSEIMRDIDLFVGVCSVGNDPTWSDGGPEGRYQTYWQSYSFGDLNETAKTRKAVLETLLPRLKIANVCSLVDKFLRVQGTLRAYKIHLGSGNILMEPNDQYLCIVANQSGKAPSDIFLPFEGDATLALILSKAFLLANDAKITDQTITRQIKLGGS